MKSNTARAALIAVVAAVLGLAAPGTLAANECASEPDVLPKGTVLLHATGARGGIFAKGNAAKKLVNEPHVVSAVSKSKKNPNSPSWFAPADDPTFSVQAALLHAAKEWANNNFFSTIGEVSVMEYKLKKALSLVSCATPDDAKRHVLAWPVPPKQKTKAADMTREMATRDFQRHTGFYFCSLVGPATGRDGYSVASDAVRHERELVMCHAHNPKAMAQISKNKCNMFVTKPLTNLGETRPSLFVECGTKIANGQWFMWDFNHKSVLSKDAFQLKGPAFNPHAFRDKHLSSPTPKKHLANPLALLIEERSTGPDKTKKAAPAPKGAIQPTGGGGGDNGDKKEQDGLLREAMKLLVAEMDKLGVVLNDDIEV